MGETIRGGLFSQILGRVSRNDSPPSLKGAAEEKYIDKEERRVQKGDTVRVRFEDTIGTVQSISQDKAICDVKNGNGEVSEMILPLRELEVVK